MPKTTNTRKQRAQQLKETVGRGPSFNATMMNVETIQEAVKEFERGYQLWVGSWVLPELIDLVPELRAAQKKAEAALIERKKQLAILASEFVQAPEEGAE